MRTQNYIYYSHTIQFVHSWDNNEDSESDFKPKHNSAFFRRKRAPLHTTPPPPLLKRTTPQRTPLRTLQHTPARTLQRTPTRTLQRTPLRTPPPEQQQTTSANDLWAEPIPSHMLPTPKVTIYKFFISASTICYYF